MGDVLLALGGPRSNAPPTSSTCFTRRSAARHLDYTLLRLGSREVLQIQLAPIPRTSDALYYILAGVGLFSLVIGAAVRLRRPGDQATLHFFWLCLAFFGTFTFSFNGRLDRLDWLFYWADAISILLLPPLFLHFTLEFPERPRSWLRTPMGSAVLPLIYVPAALLGLARVIAVARAPLDSRFFAGVLETSIASSPSISRSASSARCTCSSAPSADMRSMTATAAASLDCVGHRTRRDPVCDRVRAALRARFPHDASDGALGGAAQPHPPRVRIGHRPLPAGGRRGHRQARARLLGCASGDPRHLHGAAPVRQRRRLRRRAASQSASSRCSRRWSSCSSRVR